MPGINSGSFGGIGTMKSSKEIADELGTHRQTVEAVTKGERGMSVDLAKKVAAISGTSPAKEYLTSQVAALRVKVAAKSMTPAGVLGSCQHAMRNLSGKFRDEEIDRSDPEFVKAAEALRDIALTALDQTGGDEKDAQDDDVEAATKSTRDAHGRKIPEGGKAERDGYGRHVK